MSQLTRLLPDMTLFYNGPRCGASAPDHFHFQAVHKEIAANYFTRSSIGIPLELDCIGKSTLSVCHKYLAPYTYIHIIAKKDSELIPLFKKAYAALPPADPEPMMNIMAWKSKLGTEVVIVPRRAHRPKCYGTEPGQHLVSPASAELMGWFPLARHEDLETLNEEAIQKIYDDVCLTDEQTEELVNKLQK